MRDHPAEEPPYYWIDIFAINQHSGTAESSNDMPNWGSMSPDRGFQRVILRAGIVLALQDKWVDPRLLHRVWCLYEMHAALSADNDLLRVPTCERGFRRVEGLIGGKDLRSMRAEFSASSLKTIERTISRIDVRTANATNPVDHDEIFALIERQGGFEQLNERVRAMQRLLLVQHALRMLDQDWTDEELQAEPWLTRALARYGRLLPWAVGGAILVAIASLPFSSQAVKVSLAATPRLFLATSQLSVTFAAVFAFAWVFLLFLWFLFLQRVRRLGPSKHIAPAVVVGEVADWWVLAGVVSNFVAPITIGLSPWAILWASRSAGGSASFRLLSYAWYIFAGSVILTLISVAFVAGPLFTRTLRAGFMVRVAVLAEHSGMLDVAERCLRDCLVLCGRHGDIQHVLEAHTRLVALLVRSGRMAEATPHESAVHNRCAAELTGWRGLLRRYVRFMAPNSLTGLLMGGGMADNGVAFVTARLHAGLQQSDGAVAELGRACEMGLANDDVDLGDNLFQEVRLRRPREFAKLSARIADNGRKRRRARTWRWTLLALTVLGLFGSLCVGSYALYFEILYGPPEMCDDTDVDATNCPLWAGVGECIRNSEYMTTSCTKSCNVCSGESPMRRWPGRLRSWLNGSASPAGWAGKCAECCLECVCRRDSRVPQQSGREVPRKRSALFAPLRACYGKLHD
jgi:hypothetical protein